jgi:hypothetical protein
MAEDACDVEEAGEMNSRFVYLYRDGSNYKRWGTVVFRGEAEPALIARVVAALADGDFFIAHQVRVAALFFDDAVADADDHCFHEFVEVTATREPADDALGRSFAEFVAEMERASAEGWAAFDRSDRLFGVG